MADEEKPKEEAAEEGDAAPASFFARFKLFIIIGAALILIGGGVGAFFLLKGDPPPPENAAASEAGKEGAAPEQAGQTKPKEGEQAPEGAPAKPPAEEVVELGDLEEEKLEGTDQSAGPINEQLLVKFDPLVVNIFEKNSIHYLKLQIEFTVSNLETVEEIRLNKPVLRDRVLFIVSDTTLREVLSPGGKALLKEDIVSAFNKVLKKGKVTQLFLTDFTVQ